MLILKLRKFTGIALILILLTTQANPANAFYSPTLNNEVSLVKQHLQTSKTKNGNGTLDQAYDKAKNNANEGFSNLFATSLKEIITKSLKDSFLDGLSLIFGRWIGTNVWISNCLRDDIWELQALQEQVLDEVFRSSILSNLADANILWKDYTKLNGFYYILRSEFKNGAMWFPKTKNYYIDCPYGEFTKAWQDIKRALESFTALGKGTIELGSFGSMAKRAEKRAVKRAQEWIKANQITLTIGGSQGANPRDITTKAGLAGLAADIKTQMQYAKSMAELIFVNTYKGLSGLAIDESTLVDIDRIAAANQQASEAAQIAQNQMESAIKFNLSLNNVAENQLKTIDKILEDTNFVIKSAQDTKFSQENVKTFCDKLAILLKIQCKNKSSGTTFSCNK